MITGLEYELDFSLCAHCGIRTRAIKDGCCADRAWCEKHKASTVSSNVNLEKSG